MEKIGRPSDYNDSISAELCLEIATSSKGLRAICARNQRFPSPRTIYRWISENDAFRQQYARAKEFQGQALFDEIISIADTPKVGKVTKLLPDGKQETRIGDMIEHRRLQVDARKWALSKLIPKKYGEKIEIDNGTTNPLSELIGEMKNNYQELKRKNDLAVAVTQGQGDVKP